MPPSSCCSSHYLAATVLPVYCSERRNDMSRLFLSFGFPLRPRLERTNMVWQRWPHVAHSCLFASSASLLSPRCPIPDIPPAGFDLSRPPTYFFLLQSAQTELPPLPPLLPPQLIVLPVVHIAPVTGAPRGWLGYRHRIKINSILSVGRRSSYRRDRSSMRTVGCSQRDISYLFDFCLHSSS